VDASAYVGITALLITLVLGMLRFRHERRLADLDDARTILADCALMMSRAANDVEALYYESAWEGALPDVHKKDADAVLEEIHERVKALEALLAAVRVRLRPSNPILVELAGAVDALKKFVRPLQIFQVGPADDLRGMARTEDMEELVNKFDRHRDAFLAAARDSVGARFPSRLRGLPSPERHA
jgi:hypothetical protein